MEGEAELIKFLEEQGYSEGQIQEVIEVWWQSKRLSSSTTSNDETDDDEEFAKNLTVMCTLSGRRHAVIGAMRECCTLVEVQAFLAKPPSTAEIYETFNRPRGAVAR